MSRLYRGRRTLETKLRRLAQERGIIKGDAGRDNEGQSTRYQPVP